MNIILNVILSEDYKMGGVVYLTINKRYNNKINKDYEITSINY